MSNNLWTWYSNGCGTVAKQHKYFSDDEFELIFDVIAHSTYYDRIKM